MSVLRRDDSLGARQVQLDGRVVRSAARLSLGALEARDLRLERGDARRRRRRRRLRAEVSELLLQARDRPARS